MPPAFVTMVELSVDLMLRLVSSQVMSPASGDLQEEKSVKFVEFLFPIK